MAIVNQITRSLTKIRNLTQLVKIKKVNRQSLKKKVLKSYESFMKDMKENGYNTNTEQISQERFLKLCTIQNIRKLTIENGKIKN